MLGLQKTNLCAYLLTTALTKNIFFQRKSDNASHSVSPKKEHHLLSLSSTGVPMFGWFKSDPQKKIKNEIKKKLSQATEFQRNGKLREYAELISEVEILEKKLHQSAT